MMMMTQTNRGDASSSAPLMMTWNDHVVERREIDGFFNATLLCKAGDSNKPFYEYQRSSRGSDYIAALIEDLGGASVVLATRGGNAQGTWIHPRLAIDVARWLSPKFAVWIDRWVLESLIPKIPPMPRALPSRLFHNQKVILDETNLHHAIVKWFREKYPDVVIIPGLGEYQDTEEKRLDGYAKGYTRGQPDLLIPVRTSTRVGIAIELKHPGKATVNPTESQVDVLKRLEQQGWETLATNSYDDAVVALTKHMAQCRTPCSCCGKQYATPSSLQKHRKRKAAEMEKKVIVFVSSDDDETTTADHNKLNSSKVKPEIKHDPDSQV